jgi:pentatricopeptide repeat protein
MEALKLKEDINRLGLEPQKITFNSLILACVRGGDMSKAFQIFGEMKVCGDGEFV